ncbi:exopolysaccharide production negative regulator [Azorhizobium oxalatiphilum]|uniref:Exopolysaccharide production negative regulator n=2 Tax=Azorhizobium oxalatiphilum TaxID=980631 RepID=A0A917BT37_9HYPH|nr:exopolysaccharide production negative regulator [Azorhizobium oxalatiphilum]
MDVVAFIRGTKGRALKGRSSGRSRSGLALGAALGLAMLCGAFSPAYAFDGNTDGNAGSGGLTPPASLPLPPGTRPVDEAFRSGAQALRSGQTAKGVDALRYAADQGHPAAQWKLGRMYADGDGVKRDDAKAFEYFSRIANLHAEDYPGTPQARFAASAFVALGSYYLVGIPNTAVRRDPARARDMFSYAASYFGDPDAQFRLGKMYLDGVGAQREPRQAARWLILSAQKGQYEAQALLGHLLFRGDDGIPRQGARGLMWLTLARDGAAAPEDKWVVDLYEDAFTEATPDERALALQYLEQWLKTAQR